jgi:hypothetical protein
MDSQKPRNPGNLLNDLESIRQLLEEHPSPPLLTDSIGIDLIPLLSEVVNPADLAAPLFNRPAPATIARKASTPVAFAAPAPAPAPATTKPAATAQPLPANADISQQLQRSLHPAALELTQLDRELRIAAQLMLQDIIDDFVPLIEAKLKTRLDAHLSQLLNQRKSH